MLGLFIEKLKRELENPLPGKPAQMMMSPRHRNDRDIEISNQANPKLGSVLIMLYEEDGEIKFPLIQRPQYEGVHSGQISLPGGKMEEGESLIQTALREANEEIGVETDGLEIVGLLSPFFVWVSNFKVQPVLSAFYKKPAFNPDMYEAEEVIEVNLSDLMDEKNVKSKDIHTVLGYKIHSPYFDIMGKVVWGATAMMLSEFVEIVKKTGFFDHVH